MRVLIADDQLEVRSALRILIEHVDGLFEIDEAEDTKIMLYKVELTHPDLLLLDWELSNQSMTSVIPALRKLAPGLKIIAMSGRPEASRAAKEAGIDVFVSKGENAGRLLEVLNTMG